MLSGRRTYATTSGPMAAAKSCCPFTDRALTRTAGRRCRLSWPGWNEFRDDLACHPGRGRRLGPRPAARQPACGGRGHGPCKPVGPPASHIRTRPCRGPGSLPWRLRLARADASDGRFPRSGHLGVRFCEQMRLSGSQGLRRAHCAVPCGAHPRARVQGRGEPAASHLPRLGSVCSVIGHADWVADNAARRAPVSAPRLRAHRPAADCAATSEPVRIESQSQRCSGPRRQGYATALLPLLLVSATLLA